MLERLDERGELDTHAQPQVFYIDPKKGLAGLKKVLKLAETPRVIEGVDIAHLGGNETVASLVQFIDGLPFKPGYRRFRIKGVQGVDDFRSIHEVISRRFRRLNDEQETFPDLLLIDGGKGQLNAALAAFRDQQIKPPTLLSLASVRKKSICQVKVTRWCSVATPLHCVCYSMFATKPTALRSIIIICCAARARWSERRSVSPRLTRRSAKSSQRLIVNAVWAGRLRHGFALDEFLVGPMGCFGGSASARQTYGEADLRFENRTTSPVLSVEHCGTNYGHYQYLIVVSAGHIDYRCAGGYVFWPLALSAQTCWALGWLGWACVVSWLCRSMHKLAHGALVSVCKAGGRCLKWPWPASRRRDSAL